MNRVRIVCNGPPPHSGPFQIHPTLADTTVYLVNEDGALREIQCVTRLAIWAEPGEAVRALIEVANVDLCVDAMGDLVEAPK